MANDDENWVEMKAGLVKADCGDIGQVDATDGTDVEGCVVCDHLCEDLQDRLRKG